VRAAKDIAETEGHFVRLSKSDALVKGSDFYTSTVAEGEKHMETAKEGAGATPVQSVSSTKVASAPPAHTPSPTKVPTPLRKAISVAPEDAEMADATETASVATDQGKGKGKDKGKVDADEKVKVGHGDLPWPEVRPTYVGDSC
jgi:hypothetical protein